MGKARPSSHAHSYIPNTMFLFLLLTIQLLKTIKPAHKILSLTHRKWRGKPNIWILPPLLQNNKYGRSQLYQDQIFSHNIYLYNRKFHWCLIVDPIWLVWHTNIADPPVHNISYMPTKKYFFYKKTTQTGFKDYNDFLERKVERGAALRLITISWLIITCDIYILLV